jgi:hypothetical protein
MGGSLWSLGADAQDPVPVAQPAHPPQGAAASEEVVLGARAKVRTPPNAASTRTLEERDLVARPRLRMLDVLSAVPGLYVVQHAGGGKANQYFLRGFDADHGTDVAIHVDGVPVNMVSHGHGQGYADLSWVIGELVQRVDVRKGPYAAKDGDFATAGSLSLHTYGQPPTSSFTLQGGRFNTYRGLAILAPRLGSADTTVAFEAYGTDGPFEREENTLRYNAFGRLRWKTREGSLALTATSYVGRWNASGQIPLRAVQAGELSRFGVVDPYEGGASQRHSLYATYHAHGAPGETFDVVLYAVAYRFSLYSNFTFFSENPTQGDMIHQRDDRFMSGASGQYQRVDKLGAVSFTTHAGASVRDDRIDNGLSPAPKREWQQATVDARVGETSIGAFADTSTVWTPWLRTVIGARVDAFAFDVDDHLEDRASIGTRSSGTRTRSRVSPKGSIVLSPWSQLDLFGNAGFGFHSNDARGVALGVTPLTRAIGYEAGARMRGWTLLDVSLALFQLDLASELVWVGDAGTTEARGSTRRRGIEAIARVTPLRWLTAEVNTTLTEAAYVDNPGNANAVALAPQRIVGATVSAQHPLGLFGRLSVLHIGDRPATEDRFLTAQGFTRVDAGAGYRTGRYELALHAQNLLHASWRESQFANASRLRDETTPASCPRGTRPVSEEGAFKGCEDLHFTPGAPWSLIGSASLFF